MFSFDQPFPRRLDFPANDVTSVHYGRTPLYEMSQLIREQQDDLTIEPWESRFYPFHPLDCGWMLLSRWRTSSLSQSPEDVLTLSGAFCCLGSIPVQSQATLPLIDRKHNRTQSEPETSSKSSKPRPLCYWTLDLYFSSRDLSPHTSGGSIERRQAFHVRCTSNKSQPPLLFAFMNP
jgi:hypothetical protein